MSIIRACSRLVALLVVLGLASGVAAAAPARVALVVGIGAYQHLPQLGNAVGDARLIADKLRATGFDVDLKTEVTKVQLDKAVRDFARRIEAAGPDTVSMIYYAGHGVQDDRQGNYLIGADADVRSQVDLPLEALPLDGALQTVEAAHPALSFIVLDACRDNPLPQSASRGAKRGLALEAERRGLLIAFSTEPGKTAEDGPAGGHSPFAAALAEELDTPGLEATTLFKFVTKKVLDATHQDQFPWVSQRLVDDFYFRPGPPSSAVVAPVAPTVQASLPPPGQDRPAATPETAEIDYGNAVLDNTTEAYEAWLRKYPDSDRKTSVLALLQRLHEEALWKRVTTAPTNEDVGRELSFYLTAFPSGIYADKARARLAAMQAADKPVVVALPPPPPPPDARRVTGQDAYGNDRGTFVSGVATVDACEQMCRADAGCVGYTYNVVRQVCIPKNAIGTLVATREAAITGIFDARVQAQAAAESADARRFTYYEGVDVPGSDLVGLLTGMDVGTCEQTCLARNDCVGYTYNRKRSVCIPKSRIDTLERSREPAVTGVLATRAARVAGPSVSPALQALFVSTANQVAGPTPLPVTSLGPPPGSMPPEQLCASLVNRYYAQWSGDDQSAMAYMQAIYGPRIDFYGRPISHDDLIAKKQQFVARWPHRVFTPTRIDAPEIGQGRCTIGGIVSWETERGSPTVTSRGSASFTLVFEYKGRPQIVAESGHVLDRSE